MPVVREVYWPGLIPQGIAIAILSVLIHLCFPTTAIPLAFLTGAIIYLISCRLLRWMLVRDYSRGIAAYRAGQFQDAIGHFAATHRFFADHRRLDACRSLIFGVASWKPYRIMALESMAWCYGQLGNGPKAIELFEQVLREAPDDTPAKAALNMLRAAAPP